MGEGCVRTVRTSSDDKHQRKTVERNLSQLNAILIYKMLFFFLKTRIILHVHLNFRIFMEEVPWVIMTTKECSRTSVCGYLISAPHNAVFKLFLNGRRFWS